MFTIVLGKKKMKAYVFKKLLPIENETKDEVSFRMTNTRRHLKNVKGLLPVH